MPFLSSVSAGSDGTRMVRNCRRSDLRKQIKSETNVAEKLGFPIYKSELSSVQDKNNT